MVTAATDADVQFFSDSSRSDEIYAEVAHDFDGDGDFIDRKCISFLNNDGVTGLESNLVYYRMTNNGGSDSTFGIKILLVAI